MSRKPFNFTSIDYSYLLQIKTFLKIIKNISFMSMAMQLGRLENSALTISEANFEFLGVFNEFKI